MRGLLFACVLAVGLGLGAAPSWACNPEVSDCSVAETVSTGETVERTLPALSKLSVRPVRLDEAPKRLGYARLSFRLVDPETGSPLDVDLKPADREFADRSFLGWLGSFFNEADRSYMLSIEVVETQGGETKVIHRRPVYAYTQRDSFTAISDNQTIDFGGDIGHYFKSDGARRVQLVLHRSKTRDFSAANVERLFALGNDMGEEFNDASTGQKVGLSKLKSLLFGSKARTAGSVIGAVDDLMDAFERVQTVTAVQTLSLKAGEVYRVEADFHPQNVERSTASEDRNRLRLVVSLDYTPSILLANEDPTWDDIRDSEIHFTLDLVQPLDQFIHNNPATKAVWSDVGTDRQDLKRLCDGISDALKGRLVGADLLIAKSAMLYSRHAAFSQGWDEDVCYGPDKAVFDEDSFAAYRFRPLEIADDLTDDKLPAQWTDLLQALPSGLSGILKSAETRRNALGEDSFYRSALRSVALGGERKITLCDETGMFDYPCQGGVNAGDYPVDTLISRIAKEVNLLEANGRRIGLGCYLFLGEHAAEFTPNDLGSLAVIDDRTVEFLWRFKNLAGQPVLWELTIRHPTTDHASVYEANKAQGCGNTAIEHKLWSFTQTPV